MQLSEAEFNRLAADIPDAKPSSEKGSPNRWRKGARYWQDVDIAMPMDRNAKARLLVQAKALEARTRAAGRQNGSVSRIGLMVLHCLLHQFHGRSGRCFPSYDAIMRATGLCRQSVRNALFRLERVGLVYIMRRLERRVVSRMNAWTGEWQSIATTVQTSNAYAFNTGPSGGAELLSPPPVERSFPEPSLPGLLPLLTAVGYRKARKFER